MRKGRDGGKTGKKKKKKEKRRMKIVATTSLPAVDRPNADRWNAARSRQFFSKANPNSIQSNSRHLDLRLATHPNQPHPTTTTILGDLES